MDASIEQAVRFFRFYKVLIGLLVLVASYVVALVLTLRNQERETTLVRLKNLYCKEIPFWTPATFLVGAGMLLATIIALFLPFGSLGESTPTLLDLTRNQPTQFWVIAAIGAAGIITGLVKRSWLVTWGGIVVTTAGMLLVMDFYQHLVTKPYLTSVDALAGAMIAGVIASLLGFGLVLKGLADDKLFELSRY